MKNRLTLYMGMLYLFVILSFGLIIINEKKPLQIEKRLNSYVKENYKEEFNTSKIKKKDKSYYIKLSNKKNKHLYFYVYYKDKKIISTYDNDYKEGKTLNNYMSKYQSKKLRNKNYKIKYETKLNNYTKSVKEKIINGNYDVPVYTIYVEETYTDLCTKLNEINTYINTIKLAPKDYNITLENKENIKESINIKISSDIMNSSLDKVVLSINNNDKLTLNKLNVKVKYLN